MVIHQQLTQQVYHQIRDSKYVGHVGMCHPFSLIISTIVSIAIGGIHILGLGLCEAQTNLLALAP